MPPQRLYQVDTVDDGQISREDRALARIAVYGTALVFLVFGILVLVAPHSIPALAPPDGHLMPSMRMGP